MQCGLSTLRRRLYLYISKRRDVLGQTSLMTKRFPRGKSWGSGLGRLEAVYGHSLVINPSLVGMDCQYASHFRYRFPNTSQETLITPPHHLLPKSCHILLVICHSMRLPQESWLAPSLLLLPQNFVLPKKLILPKSCHILLVICQSMRLPQEGWLLLPLPTFHLLPKNLLPPFYCPKVFYLSFARVCDSPRKGGLRQDKYLWRDKKLSSF